MVFEGGENKILENYGNLGYGLLLEVCRILGIKHAYSKKCFFQFAKCLFSVFAAMLSSCYLQHHKTISCFFGEGTWSFFPVFLSFLETLPRPPQVFSNCLRLFRAPSPLIVTSLLCCSITFFFLIPKCTFCSFPCPSKGYGHMVGAEVSYFREQRNLIR